MTKEEAIRRIKSWNLDSDDVEILSVVIPELRESEDEKIRKKLIEYFNHYREDREWWESITTSDIISYLEKQKEKMTAEEYEKSELFQLKLKTQYANGYQDRLVQKEQSITANDLDEEIHRFFDDCIDVHEAKIYGNISERVIPVVCYELTARHFAKWGEKQKEQKLDLTVKGNGAYKICPHCKSRMIRDESKVYTSIPPQYAYNCPKCGTMEFDTVMYDNMYDNPEMEEQKSTLNEDDEHFSLL